MRVATWNIWWKFGPWEARQAPILDELAEVAADVCCLQEVFADETEDQASTIAAHLGMNVARTSDNDGGPHRFGNAVMSRWPILESHTTVLPGDDGEPSHRSALFCRIDVPGAASPWWVVCTHLEWRYSQSRLRARQLGMIVEEIERLRSREAGSIVVLAGDFNAVAQSDEIRRLTGLAEPYGDTVVFTDAWEAVGDGDGHTWVRENPHSPDAQWPRRRLDAVFVAWPRPKPTGNPLSAERFGMTARPIVPSDHYGVVVELDRRTDADRARS